MITYKSRNVGEYEVFDGRSSYGSGHLYYVWTLKDTPDNSEYLRQGSATTTLDPSGYVNYASSSAGTFDNIDVGDLIIGTLISDEVIYVSDDGSELVCFSDIFEENSNIWWKVIKQSAWGGDRISGQMLHVILKNNVPPGSPVDGGYYLVTSVAGGAWAGHDGEIALYSATTGWSFTVPPVSYIIYVIEDRTCYRYAGAGLWSEDNPEVWELDHWDGRIQAVAGLRSDTSGLYLLDLIVSDGSTSSSPVNAALNARDIAFEKDVIPDTSFFWEHLPKEFWNLIEDREVFETFWSSTVQLISGYLTELWQHQISNDLFSIQNYFKKHWVEYDQAIDIPAYLELPATINNLVNISSYSNSPNTIPSGSSSESKYIYDFDANVATTITDDNYLVVGGIAYRILRKIDGPPSKVVVETPLPTGSDRSGYWMIRPTVTSNLVNFSDSLVTVGDSAVFSVIDNDTNEEIYEIYCYIYGVCKDTIVFDDTNISSYIADSTKTVVIKQIVRRSRIDISSSVKGVPQLQDVINYRASDNYNVYTEGLDYFIDEVDEDRSSLTFKNVWAQVLDRSLYGSLSGDILTDSTKQFTSTIGTGSVDNIVLDVNSSFYRVSEVVSDTELKLKDTSFGSVTDVTYKVRQLSDPTQTSLWAEVTLVDNTESIENNFGNLIDFKEDKVQSYSSALDYLSVIKGLWYYVWNSRTLKNTRLASQIILGLPFTTSNGIILNVYEYDSENTAVVVKNENNESVIKVYSFPTILGIEDNPSTDSPYQKGDFIEQFSPVCKGVTVTDYVDDPDWWRVFSGSGYFYEPQKLSYFSVSVIYEAFGIDSLESLATFLNIHRIVHRSPFFSVIHSLEDEIDIVDDALFGPVVPEGYTYPHSWPSYSYPADWSDSPNEVTRAIITNHYPTTPSVPLNEFTVNFGNMHLHDVTGKAPVGWSGTWPGGYKFDDHDAAISEGDFRINSLDPKGRPLHYIGENNDAVNMLSDADFDSSDDPGDLGSPWDLEGTPATAAKTAAVLGDRTLQIQSDYGSEGVSQTISSLDRDFQVGGEIDIYVVSGQAEISIVDTTSSTALDTVKCASGYFLSKWVTVRVHDFEIDDPSVSPDTRDVKLEIVTGPGGGEFYVDNAGLYTTLMPWTQFGVGAHITGRTGGDIHYLYKGATIGGLPDEDLSTTIAINHGGGVPVIGDGWVVGATSARDRVITAGPATSPLPPADWTSVSSTEWRGPNYGPSIDTWKAGNGYVGYGTALTPTTDVLIGVSLPAGWYTRVVNLLIR